MCLAKKNFFYGTKSRIILGSNSTILLEVRMVEHKYKLDEILIEHSPINRTVLRRYLQNFNAIPYVCAICGNDGHWNEKQLSLQIDHINGINDDNRKENLRWLCPNCHSQTNTFGGRNVKESSQKNSFTDEDAIKAL